jgi:hypothetical protein
VCDDQGSEAAARPSEVRAFYWSAPPRTFRRGEIFGEDAAAAPPGAKTNSRRTVVVASARCEGAGSAGGSRGGGRREGGDWGLGGEEEDGWATARFAKLTPDALDQLGFLRRELSR